MTSAADTETVIDDLRRELAEARAEQSANASILAAIGSPGVPLEDTLVLLIRSAIALCDAERGAIWIRRDARLVLGAHVGYPGEWVEYARSHPIIPDETAPTVAGRVAYTAMVSNVADLSDDPWFMSYGADRPGDHGGNLSVPLLQSGSVAGVLEVTRPQAGLFSERQVDLVKRFADHAVVAIAKVGLVSQLEGQSRELAEAIEQQTATADVLQVISRSVFDLDTLLKTLIDTAVRLCRGNRGTIFLRRGSMIEARAFHSNVPPALREYILAHPRPVEADHFLSETVRDGKVIHLRNLVAEPSPIPQPERELAAFGSLICVPLLRDGQAIGCFAVPRDQPDPFTEREIGLVKTFADQAMIALENARLFDQVQARTRDLQEALEIQTALSDVLGVISRSPSDLKPVLDSIAETAGRICMANHAHIYMLEGGAYRLTSSTSALDDPWHSHISGITISPDMPGSATARAARLLQTIHVPDTSSDPEHDQGMFKDQTPRTVISVPLVRDGTAVGVITLNRETIDPFRPRQIELLTSFADQAVIAIRNAQLFDEVQARTAQLAASLEDLREAQDRLVQTEKLASLGQLTAGIAHEIKNPLNFVNNFSSLSVELVDELSEVLAPVPLEEGVRAEIEEISGMLKGNLEKVTSHGKRADSIVKNMLLHSRSGSGERRRVDVNALVEESLNLAYHGARAETPGFNVTLQRDYDVAAGEADLLPQEITRVLLNLMSNGFYAVRKRAERAEPGYEPSLGVVTSSTGETIEIRIRDNGTGIPDDVKQKMFDPFYTTKPAGEGTGLGLSLSHDIVVKQHEGRIDVATEPNAFTEFTIRLPRAIRSGPHGSRT